MLDWGPCFMAPSARERFPAEVWQEAAFTALFHLSDKGRTRPDGGGEVRMGSCRVGTFIGIIPIVVLGISIGAGVDLPGAARGGEQPTAGANEGTPPPVASPAKTGRGRAECERYVAALLGRGDRQVLEEPAVREFVREVPNLVTCGAVLSKNDKLCDYLEEGAAQCSKRWSMIEEVRSNPKGRSFIFSERDHKRCVKDEHMAPFCDALRDAAASGDPAKCPSGKFESVCKAIVSLDKSRCEQAKKGAEGSADLRDWCVKAVEMSALFAKGLEELAKSGPAYERDLARAALGRPDACAAYETEAIQACTK